MTSGRLLMPHDVVAMINAVRIAFAANGIMLEVIGY